MVTDPDAWIGGTRVVGTGRGTAFWASAPSNGIRLGSARAFQVFGGGRSWKIFLDDEYGGGSISADALNSAVHLFNEKSDKPLEDFPRETQRQLLHMMLSSALSGKLGDNSAKTRALQARLWLEEHPNAGYGPPPAPPTLSGENAYRDLTRSFARTDIVVERTWRSFWKELPPKIFLGEKTVDAETSRDPRVVDPLKDRSGSDLANRLQGREQALEIANQVVNDFDKALFRTWEKDGKHFYGFYAVDEGNRPTGDLLPRVTQRRAVPGWDSPDEFRKTVGALEIMRDWLGYEPRLRVTK